MADENKAKVKPGRLQPKDKQRLPRKEKKRQQKQR